MQRKSMLYFLGDRVPPKEECTNSTCGREIKCYA